MTTNERRTAAPTSATAGPVDQPPTYEVRVAGRLAPRWSAWFDGLTVTAEDDGTTVIVGPVVDQAALYGLLHKLRDVGIPLVSLTRRPANEPSERPAHPIPEEN